MLWSATQILNKSSSTAPGNNDNNINQHTLDSSHVQLASLKKQVSQLKKENDEKDDLINNIKNDKLQLEQLLRQGSGQQDVQLEALKQKLSNAEHDKERAENKKNRIKIELDSVVKQKTEIEGQYFEQQNIKDKPIEINEEDVKENKTKVEKPEKKDDLRKEKKDEPGNVSKEEANDSEKDDNQKKDEKKKKEEKKKVYESSSEYSSSGSDKIDMDDDNMDEEMYWKKMKKLQRKNMLNQLKLKLNDKGKHREFIR